MTDLNSLSMTGNLGWTLTEADGINDVGQIVGHATSILGGDQIFVLVP